MFLLVQRGSKYNIKVSVISCSCVHVTKQITLYVCIIIICQCLCIYQGYASFRIICNNVYAQIQDIDMHVGTLRMTRTISHGAWFSNARYMWLLKGQKLVNFSIQSIKLIKQIQHIIHPYSLKLELFRPQPQTINFFSQKNSNQLSIFKN